MFGDQPIHHPSIVAKISGGEPLPAGAHTVGRVRDAPALLSLRFTLGTYLVKFALVERTDVREIRLSQVVQPAMLDLGPEPSALMPPVLGVVHDLSGGYGVVLGACIGLQLAAALLVRPRAAVSPARRHSGSGAAEP